MCVSAQPQTINEFSRRGKSVSLKFTDAPETLTRQLVTSSVPLTNNALLITRLYKRRVRALIRLINNSIKLCWCGPSPELEQRLCEVEKRSRLNTFSCLHVQQVGCLPSLQHVSTVKASQTAWKIKYSWGWWEWRARHALLMERGLRRSKS